MPENLMHKDFSSPLYKPAGFFSFKKYEIKKEFMKETDKGKEIEPTVYWRFIDEVSAFTKK